MQNTAIDNAALETLTDDALEKVTGGDSWAMGDMSYDTATTMAGVCTVDYGGSATVSYQGPGSGGRGVYSVHCVAK